MSCHITSMPVGRLPFPTKGGGGGGFIEAESSNEIHCKSVKGGPPQANRIAEANNSMGGESISRISSAAQACHISISNHIVNQPSRQYNSYV